MASRIEGECTKNAEGHVVCKCGRDDNFSMVAHIDYTDKAVTNYVCKSCGNPISVIVEREMF